MSYLTSPRWLAALALAALSWASAVAAPATFNEAPSVEAPASLAQWRGWIEQRNASRRCVNGTEQGCLWLGVLEIEEVGSGKWRSSFDVLNLSSEPVKVRILGDDDKWPRQATIDGTVATIGKDAQGPYVMIAPKRTSRVRSDFDLSRSASSSASVPSIFAIASVKFLGALARPIDPSLPVELAAPAASSELVKEAAPGLALDATSVPFVRISRMVQDAQIPLLTTKVKIENGGQRKLVSIEGVLPVGSLPVQMNGPGSKLSGSTLSLEAPAGSSMVTIVSRLDPGLEINWGKIASSSANVDPRQFVFVLSNERYRKVSAQGASVDPRAINPALVFEGLPAYQLSQDSALALSPKGIETLGDEASASVLTEAWLDFSGHEFFIVQNVRFIKSVQGWFEPVPGWRATQATSSGSPVIVAKADGGSADTGRVATSKGMSELSIGLSTPAKLWLSIPAIASDGISANQASANVHLPLGWRALGVFGAGQSDVGWFAALSLWDWFLLIVAVWLAKSIMGWRAAGAVLAAMALGRLFLGAPFVIFLPLLVALALQKHLPIGRLKRGAFVAVGVLSLLMFADLAPYTMGRLQKTLHGTLEDGAQPGARGGYGYGRFEHAESEATVAGVSARGMPAASPAAAMAPAPSLGGNAEELTNMQAQAMDKMSMTDSPGVANGTAAGLSGISKERLRQDSAPQRVSVSGAQAGQGFPSWRAGVTVPISFSGPATSASVAHLLLMPAWMSKMASLGSILAMWAALAMIAAKAVNIRKCCNEQDESEKTALVNQGAQP